MKINSNKVDFIIIFSLLMVYLFVISFNFPSSFEKDQPLQRMYNANRPIGDIVLYNTDYRHPFFGFIILHFFLLFGQTEFFAILPSIIFGVLVLILSYYLVRIFYNSLLSAMLTLCILLNYLFIYSSLEVGGYMVFFFFFMTLLFVLFKVLKNGFTAKLAIVFIISTVLIFYTHYVSLFFIAVTALFLFIWKMTRTFRTLLILAVLGILLLPGLYTLMVHGSMDSKLRSLSAEYPNYFWGEDQSNNFIPGLLEIFTSGNSFLGAVLLLLGITALFIRNKSENFSAISGFKLYMAFLIIFCVLIEVFVSKYFRMRMEYLTFLLPLFFILISEGIELLSDILNKYTGYMSHLSMLLSVIFLGILIFFSLVHLGNSDILSNDGEYDDVSNFILDADFANTVVSEVHYPVTALQYYLSNRSLAEWQCYNDKQIGNLSYSLVCERDNITLIGLMTIPNDLNFYQHNFDKLAKLNKDFPVWYIKFYEHNNTLIERYLTNCTIARNYSKFSLYYCNLLK